MNRLFITQMKNDIIIALRSEGKLTEIKVENEDRKSIVGNIYKAKVQSISEGLKAGFVNYGEKKKGFLPLQSADGKVIFELDNELDEKVASEMTVHKGDEILVQIERDEISAKGARLTTYITIPGNFMVLVPNVHFVGISKKIRDKKFRGELKKYMYKILEKDMGVIIRTAAYDANKTQLKKEYKDLVRMWSQVLKKTKKLETPALVYRESSIVIKTIRNLIKRGIDEIVVDSKEIYNDIQRYYSFVDSNMKKKVKLYNFTSPLLSHYDLDKEMDQLFETDVYLKHGAYIIIEPTEALTAIDVNSGKMSKSKGSDDESLIANINIMAAEEIARQLRLRNIGGLIVLDFIGMKKNYNKKRVVKTLKKHLRDDMATSKVLNVSKFGLVEMTRKRVGPSVINYFADKCRLCGGRGFTPRPIHLALKFLRWLKENGKNYSGDTLIINSRKVVIDEIDQHLSPYLRDLMEDWNINIKIEHNENIERGFVEIYSYSKLEKIASIS